jgi:hypothetical protein
MIALMLMSGAAMAGTVTPLVAPQPSPVPGANPGWPRCASTGFDVNASVTGTCAYEYGSCGRFCHPATSLYAETWAADGSTATLVALCGTTNAGLTGNVTTTYIPPYTAATCVVNYNPTKTVIVIDGHAYYYVSASVHGTTLVNSNTTSYLYQP